MFLCSLISVSLNMITKRSVEYSNAVEKILNMEIRLFIAL